MEPCSAQCTELMNQNGRELRRELIVAMPSTEMTLHEPSAADCSSHCFFPPILSAARCCRSDRLNKINADREIRFHLMNLLYSERAGCARVYERSAYLNKVIKCKMSERARASGTRQPQVKIKNITTFYSNQNIRFAYFHKYII